MAQNIVQVDAFTDRPFAGNPAAVCILDRAADEQWMQAVALEMNLSETAYLYPIENGYHLRWFTPAVEVEMCGHATLATAHVLFEDGHLKPDQEARFQTKSGLLTARKVGEYIELNFPVRPVEEEPSERLIEALEVKPVFVGKTEFDLLAELDSEATVRNLAPNQTILHEMGVRGVMVTARGDEEFDFVSRFFAPGAGIPEDPVTGAAHCTLGPYWAEKLGKTELLAYQASARGGVVKVTIDGDRVRLAGKAVTTMRGELVD